MTAPTPAQDGDFYVAPASVPACAWQPIETAPKDWSDVLLHDPNYPDDTRTVFEGFFDKNAERWRDARNQRVEPTHWMPLPSPPVGSGQNLADATQNKAHSHV